MATKNLPRKKDEHAYGLESKSGTHIFMAPEFHRSPHWPTDYIGEYKRTGDPATLFPDDDCYLLRK